MRTAVRLACVLSALVALFLLAAWRMPERLTAWGLAAEHRLAGLALKHAVVDGFDMPYLDGGPASGEPLLLVHGFAGDKDNFTRIARHLSGRYRVLVPDLPGFGDSAPRRMDARYDMAAQVARLHQLLGQLGIRRVHIGGNSMGGFIAAQFAATYPEMVASVWLLDPGGTAQSHDTALLREYQRTGDNPLLARTPQDFDKMIAATTHRQPFVPFFAREALGRRAVADLELHRKILREMQSSPLLETRYAAIAAPALIVWGDHDQILNPAAVASFQALFPRNRAVLMKDIGHLPMAEAPAQTAADYLAFRAALP